MSTNKNRFDSFGSDHEMKNNGLGVSFNMPAALKGERKHALPPHRRRRAFIVDKYPACPEDWMRSEGRIKSYFVPVIEGRGMWLDFNSNASHPFHVAAVVSVQGINVITGMPCEDPHLEQYLDECPKHKNKFGPDRFCKKCNMKWPKQNYLSSAATPHGMFWLDGFRTVDGVVRQYLLTAEKMRGVASNLIGDKRVFAVGISFFLSKDKKPVELQPKTIRNSSPGPYHVLDWQPGQSGYYIGDNTDLENPYSGTITSSTSGEPISISSTMPKKTNMPSAKKGPTYIVSKKTNEYGFLRCSNVNSLYSQESNAGDPIRNPIQAVETKKIEIGAGAKIDQQVYDDPNPLDFWRNDYESMIIINYCLEEDADKIIEAGVIDIDGDAEGFLKDVPVGN